MAEGGTGATTAAGARANLDLYSKGEGDSRYVRQAGGTMTGALTAPAMTVQSAAGDAQVTTVSTASGNRASVSAQNDQNAYVQFGCHGSAYASTLFGLGAGAAYIRAARSGTSGAMPLGIGTGAADPVVLGTSGVARWQVESGGALRPAADNLHALGAAGYRVSVVYAASATINTSDASTKTALRPLSDAERAAGREIAARIGIYQDLAAVTEKGAEAARLHAGCTAQDVAEIFDRHGLDASAYGIWCADPAVELVEEARPVQRPLTEVVAVEREVVEVVDGRAVLRRQTAEVEREVVELLPLVDEAGQPVLGPDGRPRVHERPLKVDATETVLVERPVLDADGRQRMRLGIRYTELLAFMLAAMAA